MKFKFLNCLIVTLTVCLAIVGKCASLDLGTKKFFRGKLFVEHHGLSSKDTAASWFKHQKVNHWDPNDNRVWSQKYYYNSKYYTKGAPVFISLGGEGPLNDYDVTGSAVAESGKEFKAFLITVEHRFYGESHPTNDLSAGNLRLLSSQQALADFAEIIRFFRQEYNLTSNKWVAFGCSYAGNLAAWMRIRYPHLISAAVASSAPALAEFDFKYYFESIGQTIRETSPECYATLNNAFTSIPQYVSASTGSSGNSFLRALKEVFGLCQDIKITDESEVESFYSTLTNYWASVAQYNKVANGYIMGGLSVEYLCRIMTTPLNASLPSIPKPPIAKTIIVDAGRTEAISTNFINTSVKNGMIDYLKRDEWTSPAAQSGMRQWIWQTCTEFAYFQTLNAKLQPFGHGLTEKNYIATCKLAYGDRYDEPYIKDTVEYVNNIYGGKTMEGSHIIYVNGDKDPWSPLGFNYQKETNTENLVILLKGRAHCSNAYQALTGDTEDLIAAKKLIADTLKMWLGSTRD